MEIKMETQNLDEVNILEGNPTQAKNQSKQTRFSKKKIEELRSIFEKAPVVEDFYSAKELVSMLAKPIAAMREKGYSFESIVEEMRQKGVDISVSTLVASFRSQKKAGTKKSSKKSLEVSESMSEVMLDPEIVD